jgi:hypothetical protein
MAQTLSVTSIAPPETSFHTSVTRLHQGILRSRVELSQKVAVVKISFYAAVERFIVHHILADDPSDESLKAMNLMKHRFKNPEMEQRFQAFYFRAMSGINKQITVGAMALNCFYFIWIRFAFAGQPIHWINTVAQCLSLSICLISTVLHRLSGYRWSWEKYRIWLIVAVAYLGITSIYYGNDFIKVLTGSVMSNEDRSNVNPDGAAYLCFVGPFAWFWALFSQVSD